MSHIPEPHTHTKDGGIVSIIVEKAFLADMPEAAILIQRKLVMAAEEVQLESYPNKGNIGIVRVKPPFPQMYAPGTEMVIEAVEGEEDMSRCIIYYRVLRPRKDSQANSE